MLDLRRLEILRKVAACGSFSAAAIELRLSTSAVSQQIAQLEREVGETLIERRRTGAVLTPAGRLLRSHANELLALAADAEHEFRELRHGRLGRIRVAAFDSAAETIMPKAIVGFRARHPRVEVELIAQDRDVSLNELRDGKLDLAVIVLDNGPPMQGELIVRLLDDPIDVLMSVRHRLARAPTVSLAQLRDEPWADCTGCPVRHHMAPLGIEPNIVFEHTHHRVVEEVVASGDALALRPRLTQPLKRDDVIAKPVAPHPPTRKVGLATCNGRPEQSPVHTMIDVLQGVAAARLARERTTLVA